MTFTTEYIFYSFSCRYQPPLLADQVKPLNEYEEEGGKFDDICLKFRMLVLLS